MAQTYTVNDAFTLAKAMVKGIPFPNIDVTICDVVNSAIYKSYPWHDVLQLIAAETFVLEDGVQDYALGDLDIMRATQLWLVRTDTTPDQVRNLTVSKNLYIDLNAKSPYSIRAASIQAGVGIRLESAVRIPTGSVWEIRGEYQPHPTKITALSDTFWFQDEHLEVFAKGLAYWAYKLADDSRAGEMTTDDAGHARYTGQLGVFMKAISDMAAAEDFGNIDGYFPEESIGTVDMRRYYASDYIPLV